MNKLSLNVCFFLLPPTTQELGGDSLFMRADDFLLLSHAGCGPPPTAYDPKLPHGAGAASFSKGERFRAQNLGHDLPDTSTHSQVTPW